jgi:hypothetical protein
MKKVSFEMDDAAFDGLVTILHDHIVKYKHENQLDSTYSQAQKEWMLKHAECVQIDILDKIILGIHNVSSKDLLNDLLPKVESLNDEDTKTLNYLVSVLMKHFGYIEFPIRGFNKMKQLGYLFQQLESEVKGDK